VKYPIAVCVVVAVMTATGWAQQVIADFDDLALAPESYWRGDELSDGFTSGSVRFNTNYSYDPVWQMDSWDGFAYSNVSDTTTAGYTNQFAAITGSDVSGEGNYAVGFDPVPGLFGADRPSLAPAAATVLDGAYFTNTTYAYLSMVNGDAFAKQFGGPTGEDPDWFGLTITGLHADGSTDSLDFYLADFRSADGNEDYIVSQWTWVDLKPLGSVVGLQFALSSSDNGQFGMNTPSYFAMDGLTALPEPTTVGLLAFGAAVAMRRRR